MRRFLVFLFLGALTAVIIAVSAYLVLGPFKPEAEVMRMLSVMAKTPTFAFKSGASWTRDTKDVRETTTLYTSGHARLDGAQGLEHATDFRLVRLRRAEGLLEDVAGKWWRGEGIVNESKVIVKSPVLAFDGLPSADAQAWMHLRGLLARSDIFIVSFDGLTEFVGLVQTRVIDAKLDSVAVRAWLRDLIRAKEGREPTDAERLAVEKEAKLLDHLRVRFWIGVSDHRLYRLHAAGVASDKGARLALDFRADLSEFDKLFEIVTPDDVIVSKRVADPFLSVAQANVHSTTSDVSSPMSQTSDVVPMDSDGDGLGDLLELFYGTDARQADTDGDGASDNDEVLAGRNPRGKGSLFGFGLGRD